MTKNTKVIILAVLTVISGIIAWHSLSFAFKLETSDSFPIVKVILSLIYPLMALCGFLALVALSAVLIKRQLIRLGIWFTSSIPILFFFPFSPWLLIIALLVVIDFIYFAIRLRHELNSYVKFALTKLLRWGLGLAVAGIILAISLTYYIVTTVEQRDTGKEAIDSLVESSTKLANQIIPSQVEGYQPDMTLDDFIFQISAGAAENISGELNKQIQQSFGDSYEENADALVKELRRKVESGEIDEAMLPPEIQNNLYSEKLTTQDLISSEQVQALFQEQINSARDQLLKNLDIEASGSDKMSDVLTKIIRKYAFQFIGPYEKFITPLMAISLFFALSIFGFLYQALIKLIALAVFKVLNAVDFIKIKEEKKSVQIVTLE